MKRFLALIIFLALLPIVLSADDVYTSSAFHLRTPNGHITTFPVNWSASFLLTDDGKTLYAYDDSNTITVLDTASDAIVATMTTTQDKSPKSLSVSRMAINVPGTRLYATAGSSTGCAVPAAPQCGRVDIFDISVVDPVPGTRRNSYLGTINVNPPARRVGPSS